MNIINFLGIIIMVGMFAGLFFLIYLITIPLRKYKRWKTKKEYETIWEWREEWEEKRNKEREENRTEYSPYGNNYSKRNNNDPYGTGWTWDERSKKWIHPNNKK